MEAEDDGVSLSTFLRKTTVYRAKQLAREIGAKTFADRQVLSRDLLPRHHSKETTGKCAPQIKGINQENGSNEGSGNKSSTPKRTNESQVTVEGRPTQPVSDLKGSGTGRGQLENEQKTRRDVYRRGFASGK